MKLSKLTATSPSWNYGCYSGAMKYSVYRLHGMITDTNNSFNLCMACECVSCRLIPDYICLCWWKQPVLIIFTVHTCIISDLIGFYLVNVHLQVTDHEAVQRWMEESDSGNTRYQKRYQGKTQWTSALSPRARWCGKILITAYVAAPELKYTFKALQEVAMEPESSTLSKFSTW